jgi:phage-related protein
MKPIEFLGTSRNAVRRFPPAARAVAGFQLERVQRGFDPDDWKPMPEIGAGVREIRIALRDGAFRVIYLASLPDAVYVLHAFRKTSQKTAYRDLAYAKNQFRQLKETRL